MDFAYLAWRGTLDERRCQLHGGRHGESRSDLDLTDWEYTLVCQARMKDTGSEKRPAKRVNTLDAVNTEVELISGYGGRFRHERSLALKSVC